MYLPRIVLSAAHNPNTREGIYQTGSKFGAYVARRILQTNSCSRCYTFFLEGSHAVLGEVGTGRFEGQSSTSTYSYALLKYSERLGRGARKMCYRRHDLKPTQDFRSMHVMMLLGRVV